MRLDKMRRSSNVEDARGQRAGGGMGGLGGLGGGGRGGLKLGLGGIALAPQVKVPTLIPWGDRDRNKPLSEADELQRMIPGSRLVHFADAGHYVHEEATAGVARAIEDWLREAMPAPAVVATTDNDHNGA